MRPSDVFVNLRGLAALVRREQRREIASAIKQIRASKEWNEPDPRGLFRHSNFTAANLDWFSISDRGVTFVYDYGFPHVIKAVEPTGAFFFSWARLKPYIKPGGLLARIAR